MNYVELVKNAEAIVANKKNVQSGQVVFASKGAYGYPNKTDFPIPFEKLSKTDGYKDGFGDWRYAIEIGVNCIDTGLKDSDGRKIYSLTDDTVFVVRLSTESESYDWRSDGVYLYAEAPCI